MKKYEKMAKQDFQSCFATYEKGVQYVKYDKLCDMYVLRQQQQRQGIFDISYLEGYEEAMNRYIDMVEDSDRYCWYSERDEFIDWFVDQVESHHGSRG